MPCDSRLLWYATTMGNSADSCIHFARSTSPCLEYCTRYIVDWRVARDRSILAWQWPPHLQYVSVITCSRKFRCIHPTYRAKSQVRRKYDDVDNLNLFPREITQRETHPISRFNQSQLKTCLLTSVRKKNTDVISPRHNFKQSLRRNNRSKRCENELRRRCEWI